MHIVTLEYHDVLDVDDPDASGFSGAGAATYKMTLANFEKHLAVLPRGRAGVDIRSLSEASPAGVVITFDDGGASALSTTALALERHAMIGHFFMTTGKLESPAFCSANDLRELARRGHVVGSHSHSHPVRMARLSDAELDREWSESCERLAEILGEPTTIASVPGGYYTRRVASAAARAGIRYLFTSEPETRTQEVDGCLVFGRYTLRRSSPASEVASLLRRTGTARLKQWTLWNGKKVLKTIAGDTYLRLRSLLLDQGGGER